MPVLDRGGLLSHEAGRRQDAALLVEGIIEELTTGPVGMALNRQSLGTPMDMKHAIVGVLEEMVRQWRSEPRISKEPTAPAT